MRRLLYSITLVVIAVIALIPFPGCSDQPTGSTPNDTTKTAADVTLAPPRTGEGFQVVLDAFAVPAGSETQRTLYVKLPNTDEIFVTWIEFEFNDGSRDVKIFKSDIVDVPDHIEDSFDPVDHTKWDLVAITKKSDFIWKLHPDAPVPMKAHQQLAIQVHYTNTTAQPAPTGRGKVIVNFFTVAKKNFSSSMGAIYSSNQSISIPPHTSVTYAKVMPPLPLQVNTLLISGQFHSAGVSFVMGHWGGTKLIDTIYTSNKWDKPAMDVYDCGYQFTANDTLAFVATFENHTDQTITYGPRFIGQEHAEFVLFFMPAPYDRKTIYDFSDGILMSTHPL
jgi:hypothetical protein